MNSCDFQSRATTIYPLSNLNFGTLSNNGKDDGDGNGDGDSTGSCKENPTSNQNCPIKSEFFPLYACKALMGF